MIIFSVLVDGVISRIIVSETLTSDSSKSELEDLLREASYYGANEVSNILGVDMVEHKSNFLSRTEKKMKIVVEIERKDFLRICSM